MRENFLAAPILCTILQCFYSVAFSGMIDIDEINNVNYGIDILKEPVLFKPEEELLPNHIHLTSKFGQRYKCYFPDQIETERNTEEKEKEALEIGIPDLLKPLESGPCLLKAKDWWSYEFCYGKYIRQFHVEDGKISGDIVYLGYFESEKDWSEIEESKNKLNRFHSQSYVNGSKCDLTGQNRKTEVRFICDEGTGDHIGRIDEPETCSYVMMVHTNKICHHPYLKPIIQSQAIPITCNPILSEEEFTDYQIMVEEEEERKLKEEAEKRKKEEERSLDETGDQEEDEYTEFNENEFEDNPEWKKGTGIQTDSLGGLKDAELKVKVQVVNNMDELEKVFKDLKKIEKTGGKFPFGSLDGDKKKEQETKDGEEEGKEEERGKDEQTLDKTTLTYEKKRTKDRGKSMLSEVVDEIDKAGVIDKTITDTDSVDDPGLEENEEDSYIEEFDKGLQDSKFKDLKVRLQKNRDSLSDLQYQVRDAMEKELDSIMDEAEEEVGTSLEDRKKSYKHLTESLDNLIKRLDNTQEEIEKVDKHIEEATEDLKDDIDLKYKVKGPPDGDDRVKVRVTRVNRKDFRKMEENKKPSEIDNVEMQLKDELEKAGLDLAGGKVQVKIITAGYYDKKGEPIKTLSADDSDAFKDMIVSILGGDHEASQEAHKYEEQEENYSFVWNNKHKRQT